MITRPRLFARSCEVQNNLLKQLSSYNFIIASLGKFFTDIDLPKEFHHRPNCHFVGADNTHNCMDIITQCAVKGVLIMLVISNQFINFVQSHLLEIVPQLSHIYVFDDVLYKEQLLIDRRFRGIFNNVQLLFQQISCDMKEIVRYPSYATGVIQYMLEDCTKFFWYRFFFNVLDRLRNTDIAKREIISRIHAIREEKFHEYVHIDEFEREYQSDKVIWWYTRESFFYRLLNGILRNGDINEIFSCRICIQDLDRSLRILSSKTINSERMYLFRGRKLHINDIHKQRDSIGKLITMSCFLSSTTNCSFAELFAGEDASTNSPFQPVLYKIRIDRSNTKIIGGDIRNLSSFPDEEEYLFSLRSMFRLERVDYINNRWEIDLIAVDENDQEFCTAINPWKVAIGEQSFFSARHEPLFTRYLNIENGPFLAFQLLIDLMLRLQQTKYAREEMIEMCIEKNIDTIFKLRYYIYDLHNQLTQLHRSYVQSLDEDEKISTLYRGQRMKITELEKLRENIGSFISMNSFLSTTHDVAAAIFFAGDNSLDNLETEVSVLYQISVDINIPHSIPFAKINKLSIYKNEDEVLFSMASVFQIDAIEQYGNLWVVDLALINKDDEEWNILTAHLNSPIY